MAADLTLKVVCILVALGSIHSEVCPDGWFKWMNTCYYLSATKETRSNANNSCHEMDSHLAHIESDDDNTFLTELLKINLNVHVTSAWIGLWKAEDLLNRGGHGQEMSRFQVKWSPNGAKMNPPVDNLVLGWRKQENGSINNVRISSTTYAKTPSYTNGRSRLTHPYTHTLTHQYTYVPH
ncbi:hypothetical protein CAPTEDRAFT_204623 [Capitella teleta]|uniref:C-type lectin domain-containing protein n=1 Tax=Capitella teleta TaxID=283909 RepID=R7ULQ8_CAPTE|nr:hypothetical protein CAPTEDRAFT_204623 [Capitella teleta]|eukprot:ELU07018.1 hypothetical protein CAPTEDRAFT_204623 [Capitella teleta]